MTSTKFKITSYQTLYQRPETISITINNNTVIFKRIASILCRGGGTKFLFLIFVEPGSTIPNNQVDWVKGRGWMFLSIENFTNMQELLRNEKPMYARVFKELPKYHNISTNPEEVGEEET